MGCSFFILYFFCSFSFLRFRVDVVVMISVVILSYCGYCYLVIAVFFYSLVPLLITIVTVISLLVNLHFFFSSPVLPNRCLVLMRFCPFSLYFPVSFIISPFFFIHPSTVILEFRNSCVSANICKLYWLHIKLEAFFFFFYPFFVVIIIYISVSDGNIFFPSPERYENSVIHQL